MYCVNCGVELADSEKKCPLCNIEVYHPVVKQLKDRQLYPSRRLPKKPSVSKKISVVGIILFLMPMIICFFSDLQINGSLDWFGFVAGALMVAYIIFALPLWFAKPNPVIFTPCAVAAIVLYLLYINLAVGGQWFLSFTFPVAGGIGSIICAVVTLLKYLKKGKLYVLGGAFVVLGSFMLLMEYLIDITFAINFIGWSIYPLIVMVSLGGLLIYFAINSSAREIMERKLFF